MERKLELADIAGYMPYGLRVQIYDYDDYVYHAAEECYYQQVDVSPNAFRIYGINTDGYAQLSDDLLSGEDYGIDTLIPILRPMSDLVKPMTHPDINNGEEFVPLVEIAKLLNPYSETYELGKWNSDSYKGAWQENSVNKYSNGEHYESVKAFDECAYEYYYLTHFDENNYIQRQNREGYCENIMFPNVIKFLNKLHFDYKGLICKGLAIDINTIK